MCGITGILRWNENASEAEIKKMTASIAHRGPDGDGFFLKNNLALGHRRLAIIDLETGKQPMSNADATIWITYNGEIYNFKELRTVLENDGYVFKTHSDTEVIIYAYQKWGVDCLKQLRGMFAFCIADFNQQKLFLARDHFGIKPLVYRTNKNYFAFASEIKALRCVDDEQPTGKLESLEFYLRYQYIPSPDTVFHNIHKLPPAHYFTVDFHGNMSNPQRYWDITFEHSVQMSRHEWIEKCDAVMEESVNAHLVSDVPFGVFLSGGIDSTLVTAKMRKLLSGNIEAFTIGFNEEDYNELNYATTAAEKIGVKLNHEILTKAHYEHIEKIILQYDEPYGDFSCVPTWHVCQLARKNFPMVLSGDGGDELFGGYQRYISWMNLQPYYHVRHYIKYNQWSMALQKALQYTKAKITSGATNLLEDFYSYTELTTHRSRSRLWKKEFRQVVKLKNFEFADAHDRGKRFEKLDYAQFMDINTYMHDCILTKVDIAGMAHGLEVRPPMLDIKVADFFTKIPFDMKYNVAKMPSPGKFILKELLRKDFSEDFVYRKKMGFGIPKDIWFLEGGFLRDMLQKYLADKSSPVYLYFDEKIIQYEINIHTPTNDNSNILWLLLSLIIWFDNNREILFK
jgi:asparagine synthase (glutamine-hydrolysing)